MADISDTGKMHRIARWGTLGAVSGLAATLTIFVPEWTNANVEAKLDLGGIRLLFSPISIGPGLAFGLICGFALRRAGPANGWRYPAYIVAATVSYFAAVQLSLQVLLDLLDNVIAIGITAGLLGAALLTAFSTAFMPCFRGRLPVIATIAAGGVLGALLYFPIGDNDGKFFAWLALYAPWQAGYAAAMATSLSARA